MLFGVLRMSLLLEAAGLGEIPKLLESVQRGIDAAESRRQRGRALIGANGVRRTLRAHQGIALSDQQRRVARVPANRIVADVQIGGRAAAVEITFELSGGFAGGRGGSALRPRRGG